MKIPELLAPAGDLDRMRTAFDYGADAIYAGQPRYSLRARNNDFTMANLEIGINEAHARGKKFFCSQQHCTAQRQSENLYGGYGACDSHASGCANHVRPRLDYDGA